MLVEDQCRHCTFRFLSHVTLPLVLGNCVARCRVAERCSALLASGFFGVSECHRQLLLNYFEASSGSGVEAAAAVVETASASGLPQLNLSQ